MKEEKQLEAVLTKSVLRVCDRLKISDHDLATILRVNPSVVARYAQGDYFIYRGSPEWNVGAALINIYKLLANLFDGNDETISRWMYTKNSDFGISPFDMIKQVGGILQLHDYLDEYRRRF